jgi:hypothetical protein
VTVPLEQQGVVRTPRKDALAYAAFGLRVAPARANGDLLVDRKAATCDTRIIAAVWNRWPFADVAWRRPPFSPSSSTIDTVAWRSSTEATRAVSRRRRSRRRRAARVSSSRRRPDRIDPEPRSRIHQTRTRGSRFWPAPMSFCRALGPGAFGFGNCRGRRLFPLRIGLRKRRSSASLSGSTISFGGRGRRRPECSCEAR